MCFFVVFLLFFTFLPFLLFLPPESIKVVFGTELFEVFFRLYEYPPINVSSSGEGETLLGELTFGEVSLTSCEFKSPVN